MIPLLAQYHNVRDELLSLKDTLASVKESHWKELQILKDALAKEREVNWTLKEQHAIEVHKLTTEAMCHRMIIEQNTRQTQNRNGQDADYKKEIGRQQLDIIRLTSEASAAKARSDLLDEQVRELKREKLRLEDVINKDREKRQRLRGTYRNLKQSLNGTEDPVVVQSMNELQSSLME